MAATMNIATALNKVFVADFETLAIEKRPSYPPKPVGLAILVPGRRPFYHAWGHPCENNSSIDEARSHYKNLVREGRMPIFHHAGFDLDVGEVHMQLDWPAYHHDTLILAFLNDPRASSFQLKPLAEKLLGEPPTERDRLRDWIIANVPEAKRAKAKWGAHIAKAPGRLAGAYACGDTTRTLGLYKKFVSTVLADTEQARAYNRERRLTRVIINMERRGIPVGVQKLKREVPIFQRRLAQRERRLLDHLKVPKSQREDFAWSGEGFANALERARVVKEWIVTKKGNRMTGADSLREVGVDPKLVAALERRSQLQTFLSTFMEPWLAQGLAHEGRFYARLNQVRQPSFADGRKQVGTETGRLSMTPNLQNVPRFVDDPTMPIVRDYIVPGPGLWLGERDYSQQELRILAELENGPFLAKYLANPHIDGHVAVQQLIHEITNILIERRQTKDLNFGMIYGQGVAKTALKLQVETAVARTLVKAHAKALPGVSGKGGLKEQLQTCADQGLPIYTLGGRKYFCEAPRYDPDEGRWWNFGYRLLNLKIQGSAADDTKQAMLNYHERGYDAIWPMLLQVHDALLFSIKWKKDLKKAHAAMNECMLAVSRRVPMLSDGKVGNKSWHQLEKCK